MSDLERFKKAQKYDYETALKEIKSGCKQSHWMWYIFPQIQGLGHSSISAYYAIHDLEEARDYLQDEVLGNRLRQISEALLELDHNDAYAVFGYPDNIKLLSCMTLFSIADPSEHVFQKVIDKFYDGKKDRETLKILKMLEYTLQ